MKSIRDTTCAKKLITLFISIVLGVTGGIFFRAVIQNASAFFDISWKIAIVSLVFLLLSLLVCSKTKRFFRILRRHLVWIVPGVAGLIITALLGLLIPNGNEILLSVIFGFGVAFLAMTLISLFSIIWEYYTKCDNEAI